MFSVRVLCHLSFPLRKLQGHPITPVRSTVQDLHLLFQNIYAYEFFQLLNRSVNRVVVVYRVLVKPPYYRLESYDGYEKFHLVFNLSENVLYLSPELIRGMKNVTVLYLGRWRSRAHYIQVMDGDFLKALSDMKHLRLLILREISNIVELPDEVTKLEHLMILDLRACEHLQKLPRDVGLLKSLTHLDLSDCYMLYWMPKGLSKLKNLLVLKGFVVVEPSGRSPERSCSLVDLSKPPKLRKPSIFVRLNKFPGKHDLDALQQLRVNATKTITTYGVHKCRVYVFSSLEKKCDKPTNLRYGVKGAILQKSTKPPPVSTKTAPALEMFTVGPFSFELSA